MEPDFLRLDDVLNTMSAPAFLAWVPWSDRHTIQHRDRPGVYLLGRFDAGPPIAVDALDERIIYVGETCVQTLDTRWYQFHRSAFKQKSGHSGGWTFAERFCENRVDVPCPWLYVTAWPVLANEPHRSALIRFVERRLVWEYVSRFGRMPLCNRK